ncbi:MAG: class I SAM-dependent methyltransferase [Desulfuromonadaceae bacterium]|nr:class I SAM-dependent methyltransferase [Desulfuromonadaceae bacterium]MDD5106122.1 class I SAM-dependent methyltransferase [Desulfuromonadaceae bacterium]
MENIKRDFDKVARTWDEEPRRMKLASDVADGIAMSISLASSMDAMDFGCGTGLLTLKLQPFVRTVTGIDSSQGMLDVLKNKAAHLGVANVTALHRDLDKGDVLDGRFHLVTSSMTFHHVQDIRNLLTALYKIVLPGGYIAIADLDLDDGKFHEDSTGVFHNGFDRTWLQHIFSEVGFSDVVSSTASSITKPVVEGGTREFTIFLITGRKNV